MKGENPNSHQNPIDFKTMQIKNLNIIDTLLYDFFFNKYNKKVKVEKISKKMIL